MLANSRTGRTIAQYSDFTLNGSLKSLATRSIKPSIRSAFDRACSRWSLKVSLLSNRMPRSRINYYNLVPPAHFVKAAFDTARESKVGVGAHTISP